MNLFKICHVDQSLLEKELKQIIVTDDALEQQYKDILLSLILSSGKRIRPIFTIIGSQYGPNKIDNIYQLAALFELVHTATLIHDDVIDNADTRRQLPTIHKLTDQLTAVMLGNYLISRCAEVVSQYKLEDYYFKNLNFTDLCESEIKQQDLLFNFDITFNQYIEKTKNKTALLIAASFAAGARIAGADQRTLKHLYNYGINLGISFQIIDDILDYTQDKEELGKPAGQDLMNGNITLPVILALKDKSLRQKITRLSKKSSMEDFQLVINEILTNKKYINKSKKINRSYIDKAKRSLNKIKSNDTKVLFDIIDELEKRTY